MESPNKRNLILTLIGALCGIFVLGWIISLFAPEEVRENIQENIEDIKYDEYQPLKIDYSDPKFKPEKTKSITKTNDYIQLRDSLKDVFEKSNFYEYEYIVFGDPEEWNKIVIDLDLSPIEKANLLRLLHMHTKEMNLVALGDKQRAFELFDSYIGNHKVKWDTLEYDDVYETEGFTVDQTLDADTQLKINMKIIDQTSDISSQIDLVILVFDRTKTTLQAFMNKYMADLTKIQKEYPRMRFNVCGSVREVEDQRILKEEAYLKEHLKYVSMIEFNVETFENIRNIFITAATQFHMLMDERKIPSAEEFNEFYRKRMNKLRYIQ